MAGNCSIETCGDIFASPSRQASSNYGIGSDGRVGLYVPENRRSWCSSSSWNDQRAITIEVANIRSDGYITDAAWNTLVNLCVDICKRNGIPKLTWTGNKNGSLTCHYMYSDTSCPGQYLRGRMQLLADTVNNKLNPPAPPKPKPTIWKPDMRPDFNVYGPNTYRLFNSYDGNHLWTTNSQERDGLIKMGWSSENIAWKNIYYLPIYRLYNSSNGDHLFTSSLEECNKCRDKGWQYEGIVDYASRNKNNLPVYRLYNGNLHFFTADKDEYENCKKSGWKDEGVGWYRVV